MYRCEALPPHREYGVEGGQIRPPSPPQLPTIAPLEKFNTRDTLYVARALTCTGWRHPVRGARARRDQSNSTTSTP